MNLTAILIIGGFLAILAGVGWGALIHRMQPQGSRRVVVDGRKEGPSA